MRSATNVILALGIIGLSALGCPRSAPTVMRPPNPEPLSDQPPSAVASQRAVDYLWEQYNPTVGLLRCSPTAFPDTYWLATDNRLAVYAFEALGTPETLDHARTISATLRAYDTPDHGLIEALQGQPVTWPPYTETQTVLTTTGGGETIKLETRLAGNRYDDWAEYADLALYGALNAFRAGECTLAHRRYASALALFDGVGFADKAYEIPPPGRSALHETYKLALAVYVAQVISEPTNASILQALLDQQAPPETSYMGAHYSGGFYTLYDADGLSQGDPSTETTAYAILALNAEPKERVCKTHLPLIPYRRPEPGDAIRRGVAFLVSQYNPDLRLLQEAPELEPYTHHYYLTNDNALAAYTLETLGVEPELTTTLRASLAHYGYDHNGFIEVAWGEPIRWPPYHHIDQIVARSGEDTILQEIHAGPGYFYDWSAYSNLAFMAVLNEHNLGNSEAARRLYEIEMSTFDGLGWQDKAYWDRAGVYETIGPAWALYAGATIGATVDQRVLRSLLAQQDPVSGGFHTHYRPGEPRLADANVETTCLALLGLDAYRVDK